MAEQSKPASLEWYFASRAASNFPQASTSPALISLLNGFSRLLNSYAKSVQSVSPEMVDEWVDAHEEGIKIINQVREKITPERALELINIFQIIGINIFDYLEAAEKRQLLGDMYKNCLATLIMYAKESKDFQFKQAVLGLAEMLENKYSSNPQ